MLGSSNNYAFIDAQNLHRGVKELGWDLDYRKFRIYLREKYGISKAFIFFGYIESNRNLYERIIGAGFEIVFKELNPYTPSKGNVDVDMTLHVVSKMNEYHRAMLVTSDGDFASLVTYLIDHDKFLTIISPRHKKCSLLLRKVAQHRIHYLIEIAKKVRQEK